MTFKKESTVLPLDPDALILVPLGGYHDIRLVQDEDPDLLGVDELQLGAPVQDGARGADDNLLGNLLATLHWERRRPRPVFAAGEPRSGGGGNDPRSPGEGTKGQLKTAELSSLQAYKTKMMTETWAATLKNHSQAAFSPWAKRKRFPTFLP